MPVLDLQHVADNTIGCLTFDEVLPGNLEVDLIRKPEFVDEILVQWTPVGLPHLVPGDSVWDDLDNTSNVQHLACAVWNRFIGKYSQIQPDTVEYTLEHLNDLQGKIILSDIVKYLKDARF